MKKEHLESFAKIPQPPFGFTEDLRQWSENHFSPGLGCDPGKMTGCLKNGAAIRVDFPQLEDFPETAFVSLRRVLAAKGIAENADGYPLAIEHDAALSHEEFRLKTGPDRAILTAADPDGLRRGIYFLEDRIREAEGPALIAGEWNRKPFVKYRISRCCFDPTERRSFDLDTPLNAADYYPDGYLDKLAHEGVNGLWYMMSFTELPSSIFPGRGKNAEKRFAVLRKIVKQCGRFGIRLYVLVVEPKMFGSAIPESDAENHPEVVGAHYDGYGFFCVSTEAGKKYLTESTAEIFRAVPGLGGMINIMFGESNGTCVAWHTKRDPKKGNPDYCPRCGSRDAADIFAELAALYADTIHRFNPAAEYIGWFYAPSQRDGSDLMKRLAHIADKWPDNALLMFNFESGGAEWQLGRKRIVFDYSLAYTGPSRLFAESTRAPRTAAKLQVGCSHEDSSVPFIPVPGNLYEKYRFMHEHGVSAVMQCWFSGNYPGLMNRSAGELSFEPFPPSRRDFLTALARPGWRKHAEKAAAAWELFSEAYRNFPANLAFAWYGPLHHCIAWPLHLFPVDEPIAPSWQMNCFPAVSGDRIGECLAYHHTLPEALKLCSVMSETWQKGVDILNTLREDFRDDAARQADLNLAEAIGLQMKSTVDLLRFYFLREDMIFRRKDHLTEMKEIVLDEIGNSEKMIRLCRQDSRLGYHPEANGYLFFPEKLEARIGLLRELLTDDFGKFRPDDPALDVYTGREISGPAAVLHSPDQPAKKYPLGGGLSWYASYDPANIYLTVENAAGTFLCIALEPCRLWTPLRFNVDKQGGLQDYFLCFPEAPEIKPHFEGKDLKLTIPLKHFEGFYRKGFPMRMNIWSNTDPAIHWVEPDPWKWRLLQSEFNSARAGWILFQ